MYHCIAISLYRFMLYQNDVGFLIERRRWKSPISKSFLLLYSIQPPTSLYQHFPISPWQWIIYFPLLPLPPTISRPNIMVISKLTDSNCWYKSSKKQNRPRINSTGYLNIARRQDGLTISSNGKCMWVRHIAAMKPKCRLKPRQNLPPWKSFRGAMSSSCYWILNTSNT